MELWIGGTMDSVDNLTVVKCCVNCTHWDDGHGDYKSTCNLDIGGKVFSPAHICDSYKVRDNYWKELI
jgi:hypothetical protein